MEIVLYCPFRAHPALRVADVTINYPTVSICNAAGKNTLAEKLSQRIKLLNNRRGIFAQKLVFLHCFVIIHFTK